LVTPFCVAVPATVKVFSVVISSCLSKVDLKV